MSRISPVQSAVVRPNDPSAQETIVAVATPPGRGGIGVVRLSGASARPIAEPFLRLGRPLAPGRARFAQLLDPEALGVTAPAVLDEVVVTFFAAPHSYTTEDVVEIACHGAPVLLDSVLRGCLARGARLAEPGEFTRRAFLAGRLDLPAAEAVHDLVAAGTLAQARTAAAQLGGSVARAVAPVKEQLLQLLAQLEAGIDFAEDDLDLLPQAAVLARLAALADPLRTLAGSFRYGRLLRAGFSLALAGAPNAGKSSLFNRLLGRDRAIVTALPGTTRDPIAEPFELDGIPVRLLDTAGLRTVPAGPEGEPERLGIDRTREHLAEADLTLWLTDCSTLSQPGTTREPAQPGMPPTVSVLPVWTKSDLCDPTFVPPAPGILTSARTGQGLKELRSAIVAHLTGAAQAGADVEVITNLRQQGHIAEALQAAERAEDAARRGLPHELILLDLYAALVALDSLTGITDRDDVLHRIFSSFCVGK